MIRKLWLAVVGLLLVACAAQEGSGTVPSPSEDASTGERPTEAVTLRLGVSLDATALSSYEKGIAALQAAHPEWKIELESVPQSGRLERITTQVASSTLPDVLLVDGLSAQQWIRQGAFADLTPFVAQDGVDLTAFFADTVMQFAFDDRQWGIPNDAAPEVVYYNLDMFDAAQLEYPTDEWRYDEMRAAAKLLTLDSAGHNATEPDFDPSTIVQWGWNSTPQHLWARHYVQVHGGDLCLNADCTEMTFTHPTVVEAFRWWAEMAQVDHSVPYDVYSGAQTGVPGDPFASGKAAMGFNNVAIIGQLNAQSTIRYDIVQPFQGADGERYGPLSTQGYVIAANSEHPEAAWALIQALTSDEFLVEYLGKPGHSIPARRSAAPSALSPEKAPTNQAAILAALEYEQVFRPFTASAFEAYGKTSGLFIEAMKGDRPLEEVLAELEQAANEVLAKDR